MDNGTDSLPFVIAGDWHGDIQWASVVVNSAAATGVKRIFQVGDMGVMWPGPAKGKYERRLEQRLTECDMDVVFIDGNHDNHEELRELPLEDDGLARIRPHIKYLPRGGRIEYAGLIIGGLGGAFSIDYQWRTPGKDWWPGIEEVEPQDVDKLIAGGPVDILLTHDVPADFAGLSSQVSGISAETEARSRMSRVLLQNAVDSIRPSLVFCGHWHQRRIGELQHSDGSSTRVDVLNMNSSREGNAVLVHPGVPPLQIEPLIVRR